MISVARSRPDAIISADDLNLKEESKDNFKVDFFSTKATREKFVTLYNQKKAAKPQKSSTKGKEYEVFEELPEDLKYYDQCYLKV